MDSSAVCLLFSCIKTTMEDIHGWRRYKIYHITLASHEDIETINKFVKSSNKATFLSKEKNLSRINLVQNPSTCYHCYASRENEYFNKNLSITAINKCNRYEASNHSEKGRMQEFSLREVIFWSVIEFN